MFVNTLNETIKSQMPVAPTEKVLSCTNQYTVSLALSSIAPIHLAFTLSCTPFGPKRDVRGRFPLVFSITPISDFSVEPILTFIASIYSPSGKTRWSNTLFILPAMKFLVTFVILFNYLVHPSKIH